MNVRKEDNYEELEKPDSFKLILDIVEDALEPPKGAFHILDKKSKKNHPLKADIKY